MVTVIVQHEVRDFTEWKKIFDADNDNRIKAEVKLIGLIHQLQTQMMLQ